ncbi:MAG: L,D-transpeptidase family protein [Eubacterium sp.]|nr:L,D-transpeptidase family protein [Eubacterium sp.]
MSKGLKIAIILAAFSLLSAFVAVFIIANNFFMGRFPDQSTIIGGTEVSGKTVSEAVVTMNASDGLQMVISKEGVDYTIPIAESVTRMFDGERVEQAKSEISFFSYLFHTKVNKPLMPDSVSVDEQKLLSSIETTLPETKYKTTDAYFDTSWNLINEVQGDDIIYEDLMAKIKSDIENGVELKYKAEDYYYHPNVKASDNNMQKIQKKVQKYKAMTITFTFGDKSEVITSDKICSNLVLKKNKLKLKTDWTQPYVRRLAKKYNTLGGTRIFKTTLDGKAKITGGTMGWWMDETKTLAKLNDALKKMKSMTTEPVYFSRGAAFGKYNDIGKTYVEVSINRQHVWVYKKGKLALETDCVTGVPNKERMTHPGVHHVFAKQRDRYLGTMEVQGYHTHVDYFMPFNGGEGLHDAPWRGAFGGSIYKTGGSHGCVNLPPSMAAQIYDLIDVGTPVVVYDEGNLNAD